MLQRMVDRILLMWLLDPSATTRAVVQASCRLGEELYEQKSTQ
jgi:hypothetical protein